MTRRPSCHVSLRVLVWVCATGVCTAHSQALINFHVEAGPADEKLLDFADQAHLYCSVKVQDLGGIITHAVNGLLTLDAALTILTQGTKVAYKLSADRDLIDFTRVAPVPAAAVVAAKAVSPPADQSVEHEPPQPVVIELEKPVVVTGSWLHDYDIPLGVSVLEATAQDLRDSGANSLGSYLATWPQSFGGGATPDTRLGVDAAGNTGFATAVNIRGLGSGAAAVLLNGQRLAPSGNQAGYVDLNNIPMQAVDRIEVVLDSASATYGSDAVGGVLNFILKDGTRASESGAQWNSVTSGSWHSGTVYQTLTHHWDRGNFIVFIGGTYQTALPANERSFYTADLTYAHEGNLQPAASSIPTLATLDGKQTWALLSGTLSNPTASDFKANAKNYVNPYQDAQIIASQRPLHLYSRLLYELSDRWSLTVDGLATRRSAAQVDGPSIVSIPISPGSPYYVDLNGGTPLLLQTNLLNLLGPRSTAAVTTVYNLSTEAQADLGDHRTLSITLHQASERESQIVTNTANFQALDTAIQTPSTTLSFNPYDQPLDANATTIAGIRALLRYNSLSQVQNLTTTFDGPVAPLPAGPLNMAVGAELRGQEFQTRASENDILSQAPGDYHRHIWAEFAEAKVPLVGPGMDLLLANRIDADVAVRREDYSDFGGATTPRVGIRYQPISSLTLMAGWANSFRAPDPGYLDQSANTVVPIVLPDPHSPSQQTNALIETGNTATLRPERAHETTFSAEWQRPSDVLLDVDTRLDYFDITYNGRIEATPFETDLLSNNEYTYLVERNPTAAQLRSACASGQYVATAGTCLTSGAQAIVNLRLQNVDQLQTRGIDFDTKLKWSSPWGKWGWRGNATYVLKYSETPYPGAQPMRLVNTDHYPVDLRLRSTWDWSYRQWYLSTTLNYTNHYRDTDTHPNTPIGSLTTVDMMLRYTIGEHDAFGSLEISGGVQNIANHAPPFVTNIEAAVAYDQENADPYLRMWVLSLFKRW